MKSSLIKIVQIPHLTSYLMNKGWHAFDYKNTNASIWTLKNSHDEEFEILLPNKRDFFDSDLRIREALQTIAIAEGRSPDVVYYDVVSFNSDIIRVRFDGFETKDGRIPLDQGTQLITHMENLIMSAACATVTKKPVYMSRKTEEVNEYLKKVKLGQTEIGSYIVTAHSPIPVDDQMNLMNDGEEFFERQVIKTLVTAMKHTKEAADVSSEIGNVENFKHITQKGVSANLCEAIVGMQANDLTATINFDVTWSSNFTPPQNLETHFEFTPASIPILDKAASFLREVTPVDGFQLEGSVVQLTNSALNDAPGTVTILSFSEDLKGKMVKIQLESDEYKRAIEAHKKHDLILANGKLQKIGRYWHLKEFSNFSVEPFIRE